MNCCCCCYIICCLWFCLLTLSCHWRRCCCCWHCCHCLSHAGLMSRWICQIIIVVVDDIVFFAVVLFCCWYCSRQLTMLSCYTMSWGVMLCWLGILLLQSSCLRYDYDVHSLLMLSCCLNTFVLVVISYDWSCVSCAFGYLGFGGLELGILHLCKQVTCKRRWKVLQANHAANATKPDGAASTSKGGAREIGSNFDDLAVSILGNVRMFGRKKALGGFWR